MHGQDPDDEADAVKPTAYKMIEPGEIIEPGEDSDGQDPDDESAVDAVKPTAYKMIEPGGAMQMNAEMHVNDKMNDEMNVVMTTDDAEMHAERQSYPWARMTTFCCTTGVVTPVKPGRYRHAGISRVPGG